VTRADLVEKNVKTIEELADKIPAFRASEAATAPWIPAVK
jgi:simple sugar transport system substrate-binding protein